MKTYRLILWLRDFFERLEERERRKLEVRRRSRATRFYRRGVLAEARAARRRIAA